MDFKDTLEYMYTLLPMYQRIGTAAFKKDLTNTKALCRALGNPQNGFKSVHIAGTNGKGSSAHMIASVLQTAGYRTGLYTSPHLRRFTERIRINGQEADEQYVCDFIASVKGLLKEIKPSFFEVTVAMAFDYFAKKEIDIAVIEVGLGGRLDSTNVLTPTVSLITNIGYDHMDMLGETLPEIAAEKAGIIKPNVPVVVSETQEEISEIFRKKANESDSPLIFADTEVKVIPAKSFQFDGRMSMMREGRITELYCGLHGDYQVKNIPGVVKTIEVLTKEGFTISDRDIAGGIAEVVNNTGLFGRWQTIGHRPLAICDTVHNEAGVRFVSRQLRSMTFRKLHIIWGAVEGKAPEKVFAHLPKEAFYYFCQAKNPRSVSADKLRDAALRLGRKGEVITDVNEAYIKVRSSAKEDDLIFIGGSNFVIAELVQLKQ